MIIAKNIFTISCFFFLFTACQNKIAFDKTGWIKQDDLKMYPNRINMLDDLIRHHKLIGLTYRQLIDSIGEPEENINGGSLTIYYNIITDYKHDIDPVYSQTLQFAFDKDSIVKSFRLDNN